MKKLSSLERKHILLGIILMWGAILLFILQTKNTDSMKTFHIFLPVFWGIFTIVTVLYILVQSLTQYADIKKLEEQCVSTEELAKKDNKEGNSGILRSANIIALVAMVVGYFTSSIKNTPIQYSTYQPIIWVVLLCFDVCMYMVALFKDDSDSEENKTKEEVEEPSIGVQIISFEDAVTYLEKHGLEIEDIENFRLGIENKENKPVLEDKKEEENERVKESNMELVGDSEEKSVDIEEENKEGKMDVFSTSTKAENDSNDSEEKKEETSNKNLPVTSSVVTAPKRNNPRVSVIVKRPVKSVKHKRKRY